MVGAVPLNVVVGVKEAALPEAADLLRLLLAGVSRHGGEHHQGPSFLRHLQQVFRSGWVHSGEVHGWGRAPVLGEVAVFDVVIFLWKQDM